MPRPRSEQVVRGRWYARTILNEPWQQSPEGRNRAMTDKEFADLARAQKELEAGAWWLGVLDTLLFVCGAGLVLAWVFLW